MTYSPPNTFIPSAPLVIFDELIHKDLQIWSKNLYDDLTSLSPKIKYDPTEACISLNQAALVAALRGDIVSAYNLGHVQIKWLVKKSPLETMTTTDFLTILQPWINIGRLHYIEKDYDKAISHFNLVKKIQNKAPIDLIYTTVGHNKITEFISDKKNRAVLNYFLWINYINECLKTIIKSRDFSTGLHFLEEQKESCPLGFEDLFKEGELIFLEQLGEYSEAIKKIKTHRPQETLAKLIFLYHLTLNHYLNNSEENARKYCLRLSSYLGKAMNASNFIKLKRLMLLVGGLCLELGMEKNADKIHLKGYELSKSLGDQRYSILFAVGFSKSNLNSQMEKDKWEKVIIDEVAMSDYKLPIENKFLQNGKKDHSAMSFDRLNNYIIQEFAS